MIYQPERVLLEEQIRRLASKDPGKVLDVGGGDGKRYRHFFHSEDFTSVDIDPKTFPNIVASCENLPFPEGTFDTVLCSQMLEHVLDPRKCLEEIYRVLKPEGRLLLTVPQWNELHAEPNDYWRFTNYGITLLCSLAGFKLEVVEQRGSYHSVIAQIRIRKMIDVLQPHSRPLVMKFLGPLSFILCKSAIYMDTINRKLAYKKHALGWALLLRK